MVFWTSGFSFEYFTTWIDRYWCKCFYPQNTVHRNNNIVSNLRSAGAVFAVILGFIIYCFDVTLFRLCPGNSCELICWNKLNGN